MDTTTAQPVSPRPARPTARQWAALAVLVLPVLIISIDMTVLSFALPAISEAVSPTGTQLLWIVDGYSLAIAGLLVTMGTLGDRHGARKLLLIGSAGSASCRCSLPSPTPRPRSSPRAWPSGSSARR